MVEFVPLDTSMRVAAAGAAAAPRLAVRNRFHARLDEVQRPRDRRPRQDADSWEHASGEEPSASHTHLPTSASPHMGEVLVPLGYRPDGTPADAGGDTDPAQGHIDFVA